MKKISLLFFLTIGIVNFVTAQKVIRLFEGKAPGSETWSWKEQDLGGTLRDVVDPSITVYTPNNPNGIAVIIAPGGAFHFLAFESEGVDVAKRLNEKGITAFILKYRLVHENPSKPYLMKMLQEKNAKMMDSVSAPVIKLALLDGLTAVNYVRNHAGEYQIDPKKIGFMGFSAGGTVAMSVAYNSNVENRPNFLAPIYGYAGLVIYSEVPEVTTPIFVCAAANDDAVPPMHSIGFYTKWLDAKQPAELHIYEEGGHGFGVRKQNLPIDSWFDLFTNWIYSNFR